MNSDNKGFNDKNSKDIVNLKKNNIVVRLYEKFGVFRIFFMLTTLFFVFLVISVIVFSIVQKSDNRIKNGISINNIDVSGLTKEEAKKKINDEIISKSSDYVKFKYDNYTYLVSLKQTGASLDVDSAIETAYGIGRKSNFIKNSLDVIKSNFEKTNIDMGVIYDEKMIEASFNQISSKIPNQVVEPSYYIDGSDLIITSGRSGDVVDLNKANDLFLNIIKENNYNNLLFELPTVVVEPQMIDVDKICDEVVREPKNAYFSVEPRMVYPEENGIQLAVSRDELKEMIKEPKEEYDVKLNIIKPEVTVNDLGQEAFPDLLSTFSTNYAASNTNRTTNLKLAANKINGVVVMPGEVFSYNKTVGERTIEAGYKNAAIFQDGQVVDGLGGGICQISSTLYNSVLYANLEIIERTNHAFLTSYLPGGRDATVVYGVLDFRFKNNRNYPIKLKTSVEGGVATISIYGLKTSDDYEVVLSQSKISSIPYTTEYVSKAGYSSGRVIQGGSNGSVYETYMTFKKDGAVVSSKKVSTDTYSPMNRMIAR